MRLRNHKKFLNMGAELHAPSADGIMTRPTGKKENIRVIDPTYRVGKQIRERTQS